MSRARLATVWLAGCSGCHMSFLDLDEELFALAEVADLVYSPIADVKHFPDDVDLVLVEGAVANEDNLELLREVRAKSKVLVAFGDCAAHGNVTALRNPLGDPAEMVAEAYADAAQRLHGRLPGVPLPVAPASGGASEGAPAFVGVAYPDPVPGSRDADVVPALLPRVLGVHEVVRVDATLQGCPPNAHRIGLAVQALLKGETPDLSAAERRFG
ncbi:MAG: oxidoreductase [Trueperaceae bacterium]